MEGLGAKNTGRESEDTGQAALPSIGRASLHGRKIVTFAERHDTPRTMEAADYARDLEAANEGLCVKLFLEAIPESLAEGMSGVFKFPVCSLEFDPYKQLFAVAGYLERYAHFMITLHLEPDGSVSGWPGSSDADIVAVSDIMPLYGHRYRFDHPEFPRSVPDGDAVFEQIRENLKCTMHFAVATGAVPEELHLRTKEEVLKSYEARSPLSRTSRDLLHQVLATSSYDEKFEQSLRFFAQASEFFSRQYGMAFDGASAGVRLPSSGRLHAILEEECPLRMWLELDDCMRELHLYREAAMNYMVAREPCHVAVINAGSNHLRDDSPLMTNLLSTGFITVEHG